MLLLLSYFHDFWLFEWKSWIGVWLVLKHVWIHFINDYLCLCIEGFWIGVVVLKFVWEKWWFWDKLVFYSDVCCGFECTFMFVIKCVSFGSIGSKIGFWCEMRWFSREEKPEKLGAVWCTREASPWRVAHTITHVFCRFGYLGLIRTIPNWFFWCN